MHGYNYAAVITWLALTGMHLHMVFLGWRDIDLAQLDKEGNLNYWLKVQSCKLYNNKYMIASKQITSTKIFAFIAAPVLKLLSRKVLFINRKDNRNC